MKFFARDKKGSLSLSMEAIVILIIAVVMLGLALGFIRQQFQGMGNQVGKIVQLSEMIDPPSAEKPMTATPSTLEIKQKQRGKLEVGFFNAGTSNTFWNLKLFKSDGNPCESGTECRAVDAGITPVFGVKSFQMDKDKGGGLTIVFITKNTAVTKGLGSSTELYTVQICAVDTLDSTDCKTDAESETYRKDIVVSVLE